MNEGWSRRCLASLLALMIIPFAFQPYVAFPVHAGDRSPSSIGYHVTIRAPITPVTADYLDRAISRAERDGADALLLQLDTPGGLMSSTRSMTDRILNAKVPVIVWVGPSGARAASAGVFLTYSGHVASMASGTNIGAAHPVQAGGQDLSGDMRKKIVNDAVSMLQSFAEKRGRNRDLAEQFVRESKSLTATEAKEQNVVDFLADSPDEVWSKLDERSVRVGEDTVTLDGGMERRSLPMNWREEFLKTLVNPNLVYLFVIAGVLGLVTELSNPGIGVGGLVSVISFLLAMYGLSILPVNWVGAGLVVLGLGLMIADLVVPSFGLLTLGGIGCFFVGSTMLFQRSFSVSMPLIITMTAIAGGFILLFGLLIFSGQMQKVRIGESALEGEEGTVKQALDPAGMVYVQGEYWSARIETGEKIDENTRVRVVRQTDDTLFVEPLDSSVNET